MPGPAPKPAHLRQRRNKVTTRSKLPAPAAGKRKGRRPKLPARGKGRGRWNPRVVAWWNDVWDSPMAAEYLTVHRHGLEALAELRQLLYAEDDPRRVVAIHAELRQSQRDYGLTPMDLRRLQWEIRRQVDADDAAQGDAEPKPPPRPPRRGKSKEDPRALLRVVS